MAGPRNVLSSYLTEEPVNCLAGNFLRKRIYNSAMLLRLESLSMIVQILVAIDMPCSGVPMALK